MKSKILIEHLQRLDPSGETEVVVGNIDILFLESLPGYYDGSYQKLLRDPDNKFYNVTGAEYRSSDIKIQIHTHSIEDMLLDNQSYPVHYDSEYSRKWNESKVEQWRSEFYKIQAECDVYLKDSKNRENGLFGSHLFED